jgi:hypothetical protein
MLPGFAGEINMYLRESCREELNNNINWKVNCSVRSSKTKRKYDTA